MTNVWICVVKSTQFQKLEIFPIFLFFAAHNTTNIEFKFYMIIDQDIIYIWVLFIDFWNLKVSISIFSKRAMCISGVICSFRTYANTIIRPPTLLVEDTACNHLTVAVPRVDCSPLITTLRYHWFQNCPIRKEPWGFFFNLSGTIGFKINSLQKLSPWFTMRPKYAHIYSCFNNIFVMKITIYHGVPATNRYCAKYFANPLVICFLPVKEDIQDVIRVPPLSNCKSENMLWRKTKK